MKEKVRFDSNRVLLRKGEYECANGRYEYRYSVFGKRFSIYDKTLDGLREKEKNLDSIQDFHLNANPYRTTLNDVFNKRCGRSKTHQTA